MSGSLKEPTYMGRVFHAPEGIKKKEAEGGGSEIWLNFGYNTKGDQLFPEHMAFLDPIISKAEYDKMTNELGQLFNTSGNPNPVVTLLIVLLTACLAMIYFCYKRKWLDKKADEIIRKHGGSAARLEFVAFPTETTGMPDLYAVDQHGSALLGVFGKDERYDAHCWPPKGYNIVIRFPEHVKWPPTPLQLGVVPELGVVPQLGAVPVIKVIAPEKPKPVLPPQAISPAAADVTYSV